MLQNALAAMDETYLKNLQEQESWLPGPKRILAAFSQPIDKLRFLLLGESPYPRAESANGYAFWDDAVTDLWSDQGLSKSVNRATSLRNMIKMLLLADGVLAPHDLSQTAIAALDKRPFWKTGAELFQALLRQGFMLLNASLVYSPNQVNFHAKQWQPFLGEILRQLATLQLSVKLLLFGRIAAQIPHATLYPCLRSEHPYNLSFITNVDVLAFFKPLRVLYAHEK